MQLFKTQCLAETRSPRPVSGYAARVDVPRYGGRGTRRPARPAPVPATFVCGDNVVVGDFRGERAAWPQPRYEHAA